MNAFLPGDGQAVLSDLRTVSQELLAEIAGMDSREAGSSPAQGEWSIKEVIYHLRDAEKIFHDRMVQMLEDDEPFLRAFNPQELAIEHDYPSANWAEVRADFEEARQANLDFLAGLEPIEWYKGGIHQERGHITIHNVAEELSRHSKEHLKQVREIKALQQVY